MGAVPINVVESSTGLELIEIKAQLQLIERLNQELDLQEQGWGAIDRELAARANLVYEPIELERLNQVAFHRGARPSIERLPVDHYPALTVMADIARSDPETNRHDSVNVFRDALWVEVIVRSPKYQAAQPDEAMAAEGISVTRAHRTGEAVVQAILRDETLGGVCRSLSNTPSVTITEPFSLKSVQPDSSGETWIFSAVRVDFTVKRYSALPIPDETSAPDAVLASLGA